MDDPIGYLVAMPGTDEWRLWRWAALRSAGFPARTVLALAQPESAAAADRANRAEAALAGGIERCLAALTARFDELKRAAPGHPLTRRGSELVQAIRALRAGRIPDGPDQVATDGAATLAQPIAELRALAAAAESAGRDHRDAFATGARATSAALAELARDPRLGEASVWQNRRAYHTGVRRLIDAGARPARNSDHRQHEQLVARLVQRYAVKNDTIGFFGPVGWARLGSAEARLTFRPGPGLVRDRKVHFEQWTMDALMAAIGAAPGVEIWASPRRLPFSVLDGTQLRSLMGPPVTLSVAEAAILTACTGERTAEAIATDLLAQPESGVTSAEQVYATLADLRARGVIVWSLEVPFVTDADNAVQAILERVGDAGVRQRGLDALAELRAGRRAVAAAAGRVDELDAALAGLESAFERLTGQAATRLPGGTYAARTLVYEDCQRDLELELGRPLLAELGAAMEPLLRSVRWMCAEAERRYEAAFARVYDEVAATIGPAVPLGALWMRMGEVFGVLRPDGGGAPVLADLQSELDSRWRRVLELTDLGAHRVERSGADVADRAATAFAAPSPGWRPGHLHCPDVMIAAADPAAIARGDYRFVLGEVHVGGNTMATALFVDAHPNPVELARCAAVELGRPRVLTVGPRQGATSVSRMRHALPTPRVAFLLISAEPAPEAGAEQITFPELVVERSPDGFVIRTTDGRFACEFAELFGDVISQTVFNGLRLFAAEPHVPRITVDRFVLQREAWRFPAGDVPTGAAEESERYRQLRGWAERHGLPRLLFYTAPVELKPLFVDLASPILTEIFIKTVRRTVRESGAQARIGLSEMLPTIEESWLVDGQGEHYTSELRLVAVDLAGTDADPRGTAGS